MSNILNITIPPFDIEIDGCKARIWEVIDVSTPRDKIYYVSCSLECFGIRSKKFPIFCSNIDELKKKLEIEVSKFKFLILSLGMHGAEEVVTK